MKLKLSVVLWLFCELFAFFAEAQSVQPYNEITNYYGSDFLLVYQTDQVQDLELINELKKTSLRNHVPISYEKAKDYIFGQLFLENLGSGKYAVTDVYCERQFTDQDFGKLTFGPMKSPDSGDIMNTEHTWPQSHFTTEFPSGTQKSDLHHLFPTDSKMNGYRGNLRFGNVDKENAPLKCPVSHLGLQSGGNQIVFEAPPAHKGNVARALFYFSVRYNLNITEKEEESLRRWNAEDPIDEKEKLRNEQIEAVQGNRNPFIDFPDLANRIKSFNRKSY